MATGTLPPSSTSCPRASRRASSPATRTAEGPISTPRRDWPRSRGTPITRIFLGEMLEVVEGVVIIGHGAISSLSDCVIGLLTIEAYDLCSIARSLNRQMAQSHYGYNRYSILGN